MLSNLGIKRAPVLVLGNLIRNLGLQKGKKGPLGGLEFVFVYSKAFWDSGNPKTRNPNPETPAVEPRSLLKSLQRPDKDKANSFFQRLGFGV